MKLSIIFILFVFASFCYACEDTPHASCVNDVPVLELNSTGQLFLTPADINNGSTTSCPPIILTLANAPADDTATCDNSTLAPPYELLIVLVVQDQGIERQVCFATVKLIDVYPPVAVCHPASVGSNAALSSSQIDGGSYDNCNIRQYLLNQTQFQECNSTVPVQLTVTDSSGNSDSCTTTVTVTDTTPPNAYCQSITEDVGVTGSVTINPNQGSLVNDLSYDYCDGYNLNFEFTFDTPLIVTCSNLTQFSSVGVTLEAIDSSGNIGTCTAVIFFDDTVPPTAVCVNSYLANVGGTGSINIPAIDLTGNSTDTCGISSYGSAQQYNCGDIGTHTVDMTVTDNSGNTDECSTIINVVDSTPPVALCAASPYTINVGSGSYDLTTAEINDNSHDSCTPADQLSLLLSATHFTCADVGTSIDTLSVTDSSENVGQCTTTLNIVDSTPPVAQCVNDFSIDISKYSGQFTLTTANGSFIDNGSYDICSGVTTTLVLNGPLVITCSNLNTVTLTLLVTDASGNNDECTTNVDFGEFSAPNISCETYTTVEIGDGNAHTVYASTILAGSTDVCGPLSYYYDETYQCPNLGNYSATYYVVNPSEYSSSCVSYTYVYDAIDPIPLCKSTTVNVGAGPQTVVPADIDNGSYDACTSVTTTITNAKTTFGCSDVGSAMLTLQVSDSSDNIADCTALVQIEDISDPNAVCQDVTIDVGATVSGVVVITAANASIVNAGSTDGCTTANNLIYSLSGVPFQGTCATLGTRDVTLTITDQAGNSDSCGATITFADNTPPVAICEASSTINVGNGPVAPSLSTIASQSYDTCITISFSTPGPTTYSCANIGTDTITVVVTDASENHSQCTSTLNVVDTTPPVALCVSTYSLNVGNGPTNLTTADINDGSYDTCDPTPTETLNSQSFDCSNIGNRIVTLNVTDQSGNSDSCSTVVTIVDTVPPVAICQNYTVDVGVNGSVTIPSSSAYLFNNGSYDLCSSVTVSLGQSYFANCQSLGPQTVTLFVRDTSQNLSNCTATVFFVDETSPNITCKNTATVNVGTGTVTLDASLFVVSATDTCGIATETATPSTLGCANIGSNSLVITAFDPSGNSASCNTTAVAVDTSPPIALCVASLNISVGSGQANLTTAQIDNGSYDTCGGNLTKSLNQTTFTCSNLGKSYYVKLTVVDQYQNSASCVTIVTPVDNSLPTANCLASYTLDLPASGTNIITAADINADSGDTCTSVTLSASPSTFTCSDLGTNPVTLTVTDTFGNKATCVTPVDVVDKIKPTALCKNFVAHATSEVELTPADVNAGSFDNCGIVSYSLSVYDFSQSSLGGDTVLTVTDASGNSNTCVSQVTIIFGQILVVPAEITEYIPFTISWSPDINISNSTIVTLAIISSENSFEYIIDTNVNFGYFSYVVKSGVSGITADKYYLVIMILSDGEIYGSGATFIKHYPNHHGP